MKHIKYKSLIISSLACLIPIIPGIAVWNRLPEKMAVHFNIYSQPDNFVSKAFAVLGIPLIIMAMNIVFGIISDMELNKRKKRINYDGAFRFILPVMIIALQTSILWYNLGYSIDIRRVAGLVVGGILVASGIIIFNQDYIQNHKISVEKAKKINKFSAVMSIILGLLFAISAFLPPIATIICLFSVILYSLVITIYSIIIIRKKD